MTISLPANSIVTVSADAGSTGTIRRVANPGETTNYAPTVIAASGSAIVGPFDYPRVYEILSTLGAVTHAITQAESSATSANLAQSLSDETGTGAAVFGTAPTITGATITGTVTAALVNGAVTVSPGTIVFTKAGVAAMTLAAPSSDGIIMHFTAGTANAHTLTATGLIEDGITGGAKNLATFAAFVGSSLTLISVNSKWHVLSLNACVIS